MEQEIWTKVVDCAVDLHRSENTVRRLIREAGIDTIGDGSRGSQTIIPKVKLLLHLWLSKSSEGEGDVIDYAIKKAALKFRRLKNAQLSGKIKSAAVADARQQSLKVLNAFRTYALQNLPAALADALTGIQDRMECESRASAIIASMLARFRDMQEKEQQNKPPEGINLPKSSEMDTQ